MKQFIAISTETINNKLVFINTSSGESIYNETGIGFESAIEFLFNLIYKREHRKTKTVFVSYGFSRDNEFIFSTASKELKDKLFQSFNVKHELNKIDFDGELLDEKFYKYFIKDSIDGWFIRSGLTETEQADAESIDFSRYVNFLSRKELIEVKIGDYNISLANGKRLTIRKQSKSISIYDIFGFFKPDTLYVACEKWLNKSIVLLNRENFSENSFSNQSDLLCLHSRLEVKAIAELATKLNLELEANGINLSRYHGATAVTSWLLTKSKAKNYFHAYRHKRQMSNELDKATYQSYYGGRGEQHKLGTLYNVNIYDINSAYAFAGSFLPILLSKPVFSRDYIEQPFSIWYIEYDFSAVNPYFGYLPNRETYGGTKYKVKGKGYFWFPEIQFVLANFPECIKIVQGYYWEYETAPFTEHFTEFYQLRLDLQGRGNPLEKVIKKSLQSVYGKFCQHQGKGHYFNMFYAGFICSFVRRMLLDATIGFEGSTICFLTDAIHTTANLDVYVSAKLGDYKLESYDKVIYLDNGVYQCWNNGKIIKTKHKGSKNFNFAEGLESLNNKQFYTADNSIFIGHNIFSMQQFSAEYLSNAKLDKAINPAENTPRIFERKQVDLSKEHIDSKIVSLYGGKESGVYRLNDFNYQDYSLDTINARVL